MRHGRIADLVFGAVIGGMTGVVVAVNVVIFSGIDSGYESTIPEMFRFSPLLGIVVVAILAAGPIVGVIVARRTRRRR